MILFLFKNSVASITIHSIPTQATSDNYAGNYTTTTVLFSEVSHLGFPKE